MITREFLPWHEHALPAAARHLAEEGAVRGAAGPGHGTLELGDAVVALPAARAGRRLTELLIREAEDRDLVLVPPRTVTVGALPEMLYAPDRPVAEAHLARRVWAEALRDLPAAGREAVFPHPPDPDDLPGWGRLGRLIHEHHALLSGEDVTFADAARACRRAGLDGEALRWEALGAARDDYLRRLREMGRSDPHRARARALERGELAAEGPVYLVGVVELPGITRRMLRSLATDGDGRLVALVHAPEDRAGEFDALGCVRTGTWAEADVEIDDEVILPCGRPGAQAEEVIRCLSGPGSVRGADQVTVGVPEGSESLVPHLEERFASRGVPHRHAVGTPLEETGPLRLLDAVAGVLEEDRFRELAALLRHPDVEDRLSGGGETSGPLAVADRYFRRHYPDRLPGDQTRPGGGSEDWEAFRGLLAEVEEILELDPLRGPEQRLSAWMPEVLGLLERIYGGRRLDRSTGRGRELATVLTEVKDAAAGLHDLPRPADPECSGPAAIRLLLAELRDESVPPLPGRAAVEILGWLELHLDDAPELVITGMNEGLVPASVNADLFLPDGLRRRLGLPDNDDRLARDAYRLTAILASRERVHLVVGRRDDLGNPLRPSRLLLRTRGEELARRARRLFAEELPERPALPRAGEGPAGESDFRAPPEPRIEIADPPADFRVTEFRGLLEDPYRWALEQLRGLEEVHDRDREMDGLAFGSLAHKVLEAFAGTDAADASDADTVEAALRDLLEDRAGRRFGTDPLPAVRIQIEQLELRLRDFARWHADRIRAGWELRAAEVGTPEDGVPLDVDGTEVRLHGRVDRIEHHPETGRWAVLDYKTGEKPRRPEDVHRKRSTGEWVDVQLPLYHHLLPSLAAGRPELRGLADPDARVSTGYVTLSREGVSLELARWSRPELEDAVEAAREAVRTVRSGSVAYDPDRGSSRWHDPLAPLLGEGRLVSAGDEGEEAGP